MSPYLNIPCLIFEKRYYTESHKKSDYILKHGPVFWPILYNNLNKITATKQCTVAECRHKAQIAYNVKSPVVYE